jgi:hypothetical protein
MSELPEDLPALTEDDIDRFLLGTIPEGSPLWNRITADIQRHPEDGEVTRLIRAQSQEALDRCEEVMDRIWQNVMVPGKNGAGENEASQ